jgi:hypothetical protein
LYSYLEFRAKRLCREVNLFFLDRPYGTLSVTVLPGCAHIGHADLDVNILEGLGAGRGRYGGYETWFDFSGCLR